MRTMLRWRDAYHAEAEGWDAYHAEVEAEGCAPCGGIRTRRREGMRTMRRGKDAYHVQKPTLPFLDSRVLSLSYKSVHEDLLC